MCGRQRFGELTLINGGGEFVTLMRKVIIIFLLYIIAIVNIKFIINFFVIVPKFKDG